MKYQIIGLVLFFIGGFMAARSDIMVHFQIWTQRVIMGAKFEPSQRTYKAVRFIGVFILLLGFAVILGVLK